VTVYVKFFAREKYVESFALESSGRNRRKGMAAAHRRNREAERGL